MVTVITVIKDSKDFNILKRNLISLESNWNLGVDVLCLVSDQKLYLECREYITKAYNAEQSLVAYNKEASLKSAKEYLTFKNEYVFLLGRGVKIPSGVLFALLKDYTNNPKAGFFSGVLNNVPTASWVEDIYSPAHFKYLYENDPMRIDGEIINVDIYPIMGLMTKTSLYREYFCLPDLEDYGEYSFGIRLRRQGYENYIDTNVKYRNGVK